MNYAKMSKSEFRVWFFDYLNGQDPEMAEEISMGTEGYDLPGYVFDMIKELEDHKMKLGD